MPYDRARLTSYVRFYLTVVTQLRAAWENLERAHLAVRTALEPFGGPLAKLGSPSLRAALGDAPESRASVAPRFADLFVPEDEESLTGLCDVYEVVGRFTFQGEDNKNLTRVQSLVSGARNEIVTLRHRLADLAELPAQARAVAARLAAEEGVRAETARAQKLAAFAPLADAVHLRAKQTLDAVRAVAAPNLDDAETAEDEYRRYVGRVDQVYQTCLPFLRKAIVALYGFVGYEPGASWPDSLPLARELPPELITVPPADSPELTRARQGLAELADEEIRLGRAREDVASAIARLEGETAAALVKNNELDGEIVTATRVIDLAVAAEQVEGEAQRLVAIEQQKVERLESTGRAWQRHRTIEASIKLMEDELRARTQETTEAQHELEAAKKSEPVLFGKDAFRARVAELEGHVQGTLAVYAQRYGTLNQLRIDLSSASVEVQTEQQQGAFVDRQIAEARAKIEALQGIVREKAKELGADRPAREVASADARDGLVLLQQAKGDNALLVDRLKSETRRQREEAVRVLSRLKQIGVERQQVGAMVESAKVAVTEGREEALRRLAGKRRSAVDRHLAEVLGNLEKSLGQVAATFVEPARELLVKATAAQPEAAAAVLEAADKVAPVVALLAKELEPELYAQDATLGQVQREFCDVAAGACRAAWG